MLETKTMVFRIQGEFVTKFAREKLYINHDLRGALELLEKCTMCDLPKYEHLGLCIDILNGEKELVGTYPDEDYGIREAVPDKQTPGILSVFEEMNQKLERLNADNRELLTKLAYVTEQLPDYKISEINEAWHEEMYDSDDEVGPDNQPWLFPEHISAKLGRMQERTAAVSRLLNGLKPGPVTNSSADILDDFLEAQRANIGNDYGWLSPTGEFHPVEWGEHQSWAHDYIESHPALFDLPEDKEERYHVMSELLLNMQTGDRLTKIGWILMHSPSRGIAYPTRDESRRITKPQREFLYNYYTERGLTKQAEQYLEDD